MAVTLLALLGTAPAVAQTEPVADAALAARLRAVARIRVGHSVRLQLESGAKLGGRFAGLRGEALGLRLPTPARGKEGAGVPDTTPYEVSVAAVDSLWEHRRLGLVGVVLGAGVGAIAGIALVIEGTADESGDCGSECWEALPAGGVLGAMLGSVVGLVVGLVIPVWDQRFP